MNKKILIIGLIWPEPNATAAGTRMMQLIHFFLDHNFDVHFASTASQGELSYDLKSLGIECFSIKLNHTSFDEKIALINPDVVLFDRFLTEEQFGWRVQESCPNAIRILDTEDLHFLRKSRELALKNQEGDWENYLQNDLTKREIASIYRCDLSLMISTFEESLLKEQFNISDTLLFYLPFTDESYKNIDLHQYPSYFERQHFMTLGNFKHKPNHDAVKFLKNSIWPKIRKRLPDSELHVYGAYLPEGIKQLEDKKNGFYIKGWIPNKSDAYINYKVCLAPLRFGAGQKGKLVDAMVFGTPSITTTIGTEGMTAKDQWNGFICDDIEEFSEKASLLYQSEEIWKNAQKKGIMILEKNFNNTIFEKDFASKIESIKQALESHRRNNFIGSMLMHHTLQSTKYLSKWIELKNSPNNKIV